MSVYDDELHKAIEKLDVKSTAVRVTSRPSKGAIKGLCDLADDVVILYYRKVNAEKRAAARQPDPTTFPGEAIDPKTGFPY